MVLGDVPFTLSSAATSFNVYQILGRSRGTSGSDKNENAHPFSLLVDLIIALIIVGVAKHFYHFMNETWPSWVKLWMERLLGIGRTVRCTNAAAVDLFYHQPEELAFENELLIVSIEGYVSHLLESSNPMPHTGNEKAFSDDNNSKPIVNSMTAEEDIHTYHAPHKIEFIHQGAYCYIPMGEKVTSGRSKDIAAYLKKHYRIIVVPVDGEGVEVEPGLTVRFQHEFVKVSALREGNVIASRGKDVLGKRFIPVNFDTQMPSYTISSRVADRCQDAQKAQDTEDDDDSNEIVNSFEDDDMDDPPDGETKQKVLVRRAILHCTHHEHVTKCHAGSRELCKKAQRECMMDFAARAYAWYQSRVLEPATRYFFYPVATELQHAVDSRLDKEYELNGFSRDISQRLMMRRLPIPLDRCSFNKLFFRQKDKLVQIISDFQHSRGTFAPLSDGNCVIPRQLVILIQGPPGTGKTATVRCIAAMLNRHIVSVPIGFVHTNGAFYEILEGGGVLLKGEKSMEPYVDSSVFPDQPVVLELETERVVYVFEDMDAVSAMTTFQMSSEECRRAQYNLRKNFFAVNAESMSKESSVDTALYVAEDYDVIDAATTPATSSPEVMSEANDTLTVTKDKMSRSSEDNNSPELGKEEEEEEEEELKRSLCEGTRRTSDGVKKEEKEDSMTREKGDDACEGNHKENDVQISEGHSDIVHETSERGEESNTQHKEDSDSVSSTISSYSDTESVERNVKKFLCHLVKDPLTPRGMVRALDKSFAPSGRVVIFTTNHPERLPEEMTRSGVITFTLEMGALECDMALQLLEHYYPEAFTPELRRRFAELFAKSEARCALQGGEKNGDLSFTNPALLEYLAQTCDTVEELFSALESRSELW